jgi:small subunit ribosomal protein S1
MIIGVDRKRRVINLSIKAKENEDEATALEEYSADNDGPRTRLGDLLKEQLEK